MAPRRAQQRRRVLANRPHHQIVVGLRHNPSPKQSLP